VARVNGAVPGSTRKVAPAGHDPAVARRLDALDARIWAAARPLDDPQLAVGMARDFAREVFVSLILRAGDGLHRVNCSVAVPDGPVSAPADLPMSIMIEVPAVSLPRGGVDEEIRELLALAHVTGCPAVLILRTIGGGDQGTVGAADTTEFADTDMADATAEPAATAQPASAESASPEPAQVDLPPAPGPSADALPADSPPADYADYTVRGWRIIAGRAEPLDAAGMFAFCCSEASSGEPLPIHPGTHYADALPLPAVSRPEW
jgi:hypothetical protein